MVTARSCRSRPGMMDFVARAKFDAWAGLKGMSQTDAKKAYVSEFGQAHTHEGTSAPAGSKTFAAKGAFSRVVKAPMLPAGKAGALWIRRCSWYLLRRHVCRQARCSNWRRHWSRTRHSHDTVKAWRSSECRALINNVSIRLGLVCRLS